MALVIGIAVGGVVAGALFLLVGRPLLRRRADTAKREMTAVVLRALAIMPALWLAGAGFYVALHMLPLRPEFNAWVDKVAVIVAIATASVVLARIAAGAVRAWATRALNGREGTSIFSSLALVVVLVVGLLVILQYLGLSIAPMLTALGVGGLAVALALQDTLANLFAGFQILGSRQVRPGDFVMLSSGEKGTVIDINWRNTTINALQNNIYVVPNKKLADSIVTNYTLPEPEMSVLVDVGVSYGSDLGEVEAVTLDVAREVLSEVEGGISDFEPLVRFHTFADSSVDLTVILRVSTVVDQYLLKHELVKRLHRRYRSEGIEIPFPIRTVELRRSS